MLEFAPGSRLVRGAEDRMAEQVAASPADFGPEPALEQAR